MSPSRALVLTLLTLAPACGSEPESRESLIERILAERAGHLEGRVRSSIADAVIRAENRHGIDALLLIAIAEQESHYRPRAVSRFGAVGLMQLLPPTAEDVAARNKIQWHGEESLTTPSISVDIASAYLEELYDRFGSWPLALAAYHNGPTRVGVALDDGRTVRSGYAGRVLRCHRALSAIYASMQAGPPTS